MPTTKCPECGAAIKDDSKFCNYCGAKLPDDTKRVEIKIDKRIEDVAEIKRAKYEEKESELRQKQIIRENHVRKAKRISAYLLIVIGLLAFVLITFSDVEPLLKFYGILGLILAVSTGGWIISQLFTGKW